jgi:hypothetical protein
MKIRSLIWLIGILLINTACYQPVERPEQEIINNSVGGYTGAYPEYVVSSSSSTSNDYDNPWNCGTEWILLKDPEGKLFYVEIYRNCDPFADIYKGCPSPLDK